MTIGNHQHLQHHLETVDNSARRRRWRINESIYLLTDVQKYSHILWKN